MIKRASPKDVPSHAVVMTPEAALEWQIARLDQWSPKRDTFIVRYFPGILVAGAGLSGIYYANPVRQKLMLRNNAKFLAVVSMAAIAGTMSAMGHIEYVLSDVLIGKHECRLCIPARSGILQVITGAMVPAFLAPFISITSAISYQTYPVPNFLDFQEYKYFVSRLIKPLKRRFFIMAAVQFLLGVAAIEVEHYAYVRFEMKALAREIEKFESEQSKNAA